MKFVATRLGYKGLLLLTLSTFIGCGGGTPHSGSTPPQRLQRQRSQLAQPPLLKGRQAR